MKKKLLLFAAVCAVMMLFVTLLTVSSSATTYSGNCGLQGDNLTWTLDTETGALEIEGKGAMKDYSFRSSPWYSYRSNIKSVALPEGITRIGSYAFEDCISLVSVALPEGLTSIGSSAFDECYKLVEVYNKSPLNITYNSISFGCVANYAKNIYTPTSGESMLIYQGDYIFYNDNGTYYLVGYTGKETAPTLPQNINGNKYSIYNYAFAYCSNLKSITLPEGLISIGYDAFYNTAYYKNESNWENDVLYIGKYLINARTSLSGAYQVKEGTAVIGNYAFYDCTGLTSITIPEGITSIGDCAFYDCTGLKSITIPEGITSIGDYAFYYCSALVSISLPESLTSIGKYMFYHCNKLALVSLPKSLESISNGMFCYCTDLTSIELPANITSIGNYAFESCYHLESIVLPESITSIGNGAFESCYHLTSIILPKGLTSLGDEVFENCTELTSITIPDGVTSIGKKAFYSCELLRSITLPKNLKNIGDLAFEYCYDLVSITLPESTSSIGTNAFYGCKNLKFVYVSSPVVASALSSDSSCGYLVKYAQTLAIPSNITGIGSFATENFTYMDAAIYLGTEYDVYSKHSHAEDDSVWIIYGNGSYRNEKCSSCGLIKDHVHVRPDVPSCIETECEKCGEFLYAIKIHTRDASHEDCEDSVCIYCGMPMSAVAEHVRLAEHKDCEDSECIHCGMEMPAITSHLRPCVPLCEETSCTVCGAAFAVEPHTRFAEHKDCEESECIYCGAFMEASSDHTRPQNAPLCKDTRCTECFVYIFASVGHERELGYEECEKAPCATCGMEMPALTSHTRPENASDCEDSACSLCSVILPAIADHTWSAWKEISSIGNTGKATVERVCLNDAEHIETKERIAPRVTGAVLNVSSDINIKYIVTLPSGFSKAYAVFAFNGVNYTVNAYTAREDGEYVFAFEGITPQCLGDAVTVTIYAEVDGLLLAAQKSNYSVRTYCENQLIKYASDTRLVSLISDLLTYGAKSQIYMNYKTDALVTEGLALFPSTFTAVDKACNKKALIGIADASAKWKSVGLRYENAMAMYFRFTATDTEKLAVKVTIGGRTSTYTAEDFKCEGDNTYRIDFRGIAATEFNETVTASFERDGVAIGQRVTYSVNSYIYLYQNSEDIALSKLLCATYFYGLSSYRYVNGENYPGIFNGLLDGEDNTKDDIDWDA